MKAIITSDLHLTDRPQDEYRWGIFPWLVKQSKEFEVEHLFILGDLTDFKDKHSSTLVNRIVKEIEYLSGRFPKLKILMGNHDYVDPEQPFFCFLDRIVYDCYIKHTTTTYVKRAPVLCIPHRRNLEEFLELKPEFERAEYIFMHQTLYGSLTSSGVTLEGEDTLKPDIFNDTEALCFSGDIHVPQKVGKVIYCGSPYTIRFNDTFTPRVLLLDGDDITDLHYPTIKKCTVVVKKASDLKDPKHNLNPGDQVKVRLRLNSNELLDWSRYKREVSEVCKELNVDLYGVELYKQKRERLVTEEHRTKLAGVSSDQEVFDKYCDKEKIDDWLKELGSKVVAEF